MRAFARHFGLDAQVLLAGVHGRRDVDVIARWLPPSQADEAIAWMRTAEFNHRDLPLVPGAADAIAALSGARCAIASSASRRALEAWLRAKAFAPATALVSASDVTHGKPDPECYLLAASKVGVPPSNCVVEDAPPGIEAANRAGIGHVIAVETTHPAGALQEATVVVPDLGRVRFEVVAGRIAVTW